MKAETIFHAATHRGQQLAEAERRLARITGRPAGCAYTAARHGTWELVFVADEALALTGLAASHWLGSPLLALGQAVNAEDGATARQELEAALIAGRPFATEYRLLGPHGEERWLGDRGALIAIADGELILEGIIHDISAHKRDEEQQRILQQQLCATQRLEAVGHITGGIAHDVNNLLTVIQSCADFALERADDVLRPDLEIILDATSRGATLITKLVASARRQFHEPDHLHLNELITGLKGVLLRLVGNGISVHFDLDPSLNAVYADVSQVEQVLLNLVINARDATPDGGQITIQTANVHLDEAYGAARKVCLQPGPHVLMAISDSGTGIPPELQQRIFDPYFTTKRPGQGTGLGLSTVYGIVKQSNGWIWADSEPGQGATIKVFLPSHGDATTTQPVAPPEQPRLAGTETILLVEDIEPVRRTTAHVLRSNGYEVLEASGGTDALARCELEHRRIDLLLTDIIMPDMSGRELASRFLRHQPSAKVVYMSGYADQTIVERGLIDQGAFFLPKPFSSNALLAKVRSRLDRASLGPNPG